MVIRSFDKWVNTLAVTLVVYSSGLLTLPVKAGSKIYDPPSPVGISFSVRVSDISDSEVIEGGSYILDPALTGSVSNPDE